MPRNMQIKNRRGDIPVTILVLMVIIICILTILSFSYSRTASQDSFFGVGLIETVKSVSEEASFYEKTQYTSDYGNLFNSGNVKVTINGNIIEGNYSKKGFSLFGSGKEKVLVSVTYQK